MSRLLLFLFCFQSGCSGEDPVLKAAREATNEAAAPQLKGTAMGRGAAPVSGGHPIDGGLASQAGGAGELTQGVPKQPLEAGVPNTPAPGVPGLPQAGVPGLPQAGVPGLPQAGVPGEPPPGEPSEGKEEDQGPQVVISGHVRMKEYEVGAIRLDFFDGDHRSHAGQRPSLIRSMELSAPGEFKASLPLSVAKVWIEASNDENQDGRPGPRDPSGRYLRNPLVLLTGGASGIVINLERNAAPPGGSAGSEL
jgi:hypothetical protein